MKKEKIRGITFGSFDLCHYGHALMFEECKQYCDYLILEFNQILVLIDLKKIHQFNHILKEWGL